MISSNVQVFLAVVNEKSFRKAANSLGYTQAGISYAIQSMEQELNLTLFVRDRGGVHLTSEGYQLLPYFKQLEIDNRVLHQAADELNGLEKGTLRIQIFDSISVHWIPGILQKYKEDFPGIQIELISEEDSLKAEEMVLSGEVDCGFFLTDVSANLDVIRLKEEHLKAVVSMEHELAKEKYFKVGDLGKYPYIGMKYDSHTGIHKIFERYNAIPDASYVMDNDYAAMAMVSKNLGFAIFPELLLQVIPYEIHQMDFDIPQKRTIRIGCRDRKTASKACLKFIEYVVEWVKENT